MRIIKTSRSWRLISLGIAVMASLTVFASVAGAEEDESEPAAKSDASGLKWVGGNSGSQLMHPGLSCIVCHSRGEGPRYQVAGTVYAALDQRDDYYGVADVVVQVTDAKGKVAKYATNKAGNFYSGHFSSLKAPFAVKVLGKKGERAMGSPAPSGDCASCHTAAGAEGAPGRVIAP